MERIQHIWEETGLSRKRLGAIYVPREDPRIIVCDPHFIANAAPLSALLAADQNWSVTLLTRRVEGYTRVVAVTVALEHAKPLAWSPAEFEDGSTTFAVDYATACVTDAGTAADIAKFPLLQEQFMRCIDGPWDCVFLNTEDGCGDVAWFGSGLGDGNYKAWWGADDKDQIVALCIDFDVFLSPQVELA
jgi:hypothetical protein